MNTEFLTLLIASDAGLFENNSARFCLVGFHQIDYKWMATIFKMLLENEKVLSQV